jgi:hypothetical protein
MEDGLVSCAAEYTRVGMHIVYKQSTTGGHVKKSLRYCQKLPIPRTLPNANACVQANDNTRPHGFHTWYSRKQYT